MNDRQKLIALLQSEAADAMPAKKAREFGRFLDQQDPPQAKLPLRTRR